MYNPYFLKQWALHRYKDGPLSSHLVGYAIFLKDKDYAYSSGQRYVREVAHLSVWMKKHKIAIEKVDENLIRQYIPYRKGASIRIKISPYWLLLKYLREENIIRVAPVLKCTPAQKIISDFENFLLNERGLTNETIRHYLRFTREFIHEYSSKNGLRLDHISVEDLTNHIIHNSQACARSYAMRQFIRFLFLRGLIACDISMAIPHIPHWRQCHLPSFLEPHETRACLNASEVETPIGSRDLAIKLLLVQLGLRAIEICRLKLSDIDWENSRITITGKGGGKHLLPLPYEAGKSLVNYLRHGRPKCADRHVFIR